MKPILIFSLLLLACQSFADDIVLTNEHGMIVPHRPGRGRLTVKMTLETNWLPMTLKAPNGDGTTRDVHKEVGIIISNRHAEVIAEGTTNIILLSSKMVHQQPMLRDASRPTLTNSLPKIFYITNFTHTNFIPQDSQDWWK